MKLYILIHPNWVNDNEQLKQMETEIEASEKAIIFETMFITSVRQKRLELDNEDHLLVAGAHGLNLAKEVRESYPQIKITWWGDKLVGEFYTLKPYEWPNSITLPRSEITQEFRNNVPSCCELLQSEVVPLNFKSYNPPTTNDSKKTVSPSPLCVFGITGRRIYQVPLFKYENTTSINYQI